MTIKKKSEIRHRPKKMSVALSTKKTIHETDYEKDFFLWTQEQSKLLQKRDFSKLDVENLKEEIESLGISDKRAIKNHLINLMLHLLKIQYQSQKHTKSWDSSIKNSRKAIYLICDDSPSLRNQLKKMILDSYKYARSDAASETGLDESIFPEECPFGIEILK